MTIASWGPHIIYDALVFPRVEMHHLIEKGHRGGESSANVLWFSKGAWRKQSASQVWLWKGFEKIHNKRHIGGWLRLAVQKRVPPNDYRNIDWKNMQYFCSSYVDIIDTSVSDWTVQSNFWGGHVSLRRLVLTLIFPSNDASARNAT